MTSCRPPGPQQRRSSQWHVRSWISGHTIAFRAWARPPTPILSSISCRAFSNCWGVPRMEKMRTLGSVLGGGFLCSSTWARDCSLMFLMVSPPGGAASDKEEYKQRLLTMTSTNVYCRLICWWFPWSEEVRSYRKITKNHIIKDH